MQMTNTYKQYHVCKNEFVILALSKAVVPNPRSADQYRSVGQLVPVRTGYC